MSEAQMLQNQMVHIKDIYLILNAYKKAYKILEETCRGHYSFNAVEESLFKDKEILKDVKIMERTNLENQKI